jgi:hypothetical protein
MDIELFDELLRSDSRVLRRQVFGTFYRDQKGQLKAKVPERFETMGSVRSEGRGEEFLIAQHASFSSLIVAEHQAHWLERVLADAHEREKKHSDRTPDQNSTALFALVCIDLESRAAIAFTPRHSRFPL